MERILNSMCVYIVRIYQFLKEAQCGGKGEEDID